MKLYLVKESVYICHWDAQQGNGGFKHAAAHDAAVLLYLALPCMLIV